MKRQICIELVLSATLVVLGMTPGLAQGSQYNEDWAVINANTTSPASAPWFNIELDTPGNVGQYTSVAIDPFTGFAYVSYYDATNEALRMAQYVGSGGNCGPNNDWSCETVDSGADVGKYSSIAIDHAGGVGIAYHDATSGKLKYAFCALSPACGWHKFTVDISMGLASASLQAPGVALEPDHSQQADPGQAIVYNHVLTNTGTTTDTFLLDVQSAQGWPVHLLSATLPTGTSTLTLRVAPLMTASLQVSFTVPLQADGVTELTTVTATSQVSPTVYDTAVDTTTIRSWIYFPLVFKRWPPLPYQPTLHSIDNTDGDGNYSVSWTEQPSRLADTYTLQEATNRAFTSDVRDVCTTASQSCQVSGGPADTYYYRVRGHNTWGYGQYSNIQDVSVLPPSSPTLNPISNDDGNSTYSVTWSAAARATWYKLQEDTDQSFGSPETVYQGPNQSWDTSDQAEGAYYYRVKALGPTGQSAWSNVESVAVFPPPDIEVVEHAGATHFLKFGNLVGGGYSAYGITEIRNNTQCIRGLIEVKMTIMSNQTVEVTAYTNIWGLKPGQSSPVEFVTSLAASFEPDGAHANVTVISKGYCTSTDSQSGLEISSESLETRPGKGTFWVTGTVTNTTNSEKLAEILMWNRYDPEHPGLITEIESQWKDIPPYGADDFLFRRPFSGPEGGRLDYGIIGQH